MGNYNGTVLSIAGFDPSGGAGILADIKTFEACGVTGMGVLTSVTFQNDVEFDSVSWIPVNNIIKQISVLEKRYGFSFIKIGLIENLAVLDETITYCRNVFPDAEIIWDPITKASAGFEFHKSFSKKELDEILEKCFLITPNTEEACLLAGIRKNYEASSYLAQFTGVLLKGGHNTQHPGTDYLFHEGKITELKPVKKEVFPKHGTGCILSSAITSYLSLGFSLYESCLKGKSYTEKYMAGTESLIGKHYV